MFSCTSAEPAKSAGGGGCLCHQPEIQTLTRRINADLSRRGFVAGAGASIASLGLAHRAKAQTPPGHCHGNLFLLIITHPPAEAATSDSNRLALRSN
jgi:hypothetical protein